MIDLFPPFTITSASLIGARAINQDAFSWAAHGDPASTGYLVTAVADGMGSQPESGLVARAAVDAAVAIGAALEYQSDPVHLIHLAGVAVGAFAEYAQRKDVFYAYADGENNPDTTLVVATIGHDGEVQIGWIGDSRAYVRITDGRLIPITHDHNLGHIGHPHVLTRTLRHLDKGPEHAAWHPSRRHEFTARQILLTTDGIHDVLTDEVIAYALSTARTPSRAVAWLTQWAVRAAGIHADNATAVLITFADNLPGPAAPRTRLPRPDRRRPRKNW
ncbi:PP2C family protein-serine/threonine phosphatase [Nocardia farcinica]|uniref:PP2C family protein-serine/threonine phosphatase n=1 Tax=Nocardia farcinica TaxID=37329 RepID=UPI000E02B78B|nr:protein phosphatase 2C domain-containing protein [Nocardia farcinica]MBF6250180.1 protein phosphatase 2C domain-containing protein [Nocardia farcinica]MBF6445522.1 protein phosphatase 2C domain-containing protein [Nocardia farcinica]MBF6523312.1 protein phosphatase 2C domain-containing protein [Nocardia farcinica]SUE27738.1 Uncharacterised protein [Nocardia farcinica]